MITYQVITPPAQEPVLLADAKQHLRVDTTADDLYIEGLITACRFHLEQQYDIALITQTLQLNLDYFPYWWLWRGSSTNTYSWWADQAWYTQILLRGPVQSIGSVKYTDPSGNPQTLSSSVYSLDQYSRPGRLCPARNQMWPATAQATVNAVQVQFTTGFGPADTDVPGDIKAALKMLLGHFYENREEVVTDARVAAIQMPIGVDRIMRAVLEWGPAGWSHDLARPLLRARQSLRSVLRILVRNWLGHRRSGDHRRVDPDLPTPYVPRAGLLADLSPSGRGDAAPRLQAPPSGSSSHRTASAR